MNGFTTKKIRKGPPPSNRPAGSPPLSPILDATSTQNSAPTKGRFRKKILHFIARHFIWSAIIFVLCIGVAKATYRIVTLAENFSFKEFVFSAFSNPLETDKNGHTNILLLGTGNETHDGANLTDTIILASVDKSAGTVSMLSIPRDLFVEIDELYGWNRINSILELVAQQEMYDNPAMSEEQAYSKGFDVLVQTVSEILNIPIHYYARINFDGFTQIVDAIDGVDINVEEAIYDPLYPADNGSIHYQTFSVEVGLQHFDGETALKYARSRETTSDYSRSQRQQAVLSAIKEKALSLGVLTSPTKLKNIYNAIGDNFTSDLSWEEIVYLAKIADKFDRENIYSWGLNDNPLSTGGFLYTPPREEGEAFSLLPYVSDYSDIQLFANLVLLHPEVHASGTTYQALNGTTVNGVASQTLYYLIRFGFDVVRYGNAPNRATPITRILPLSALLAGQSPEKAVNDNDSLQFLMKNFIPVGFTLNDVPTEYSPIEWESEADIILELGQDYVDWMTQNSKHFY